FTEGSYEPIQTDSDPVFGFMRGGRVATIVPRLPMSINEDLDEGMKLEFSGNWRNAFDGRDVIDVVTVADLWRDFPVALLVKVE
ncbi:MAG: hypothetical protein M3290_10940, partial [Actinomycetota bacterium]|nr:hypothetical protein [Actinomycetota bacterium]